MFNIGICEESYFDNFFEFNETTLLRSKLDCNFKKRILHTVENKEVQDTTTIQKNGTNCIINYNFYNEGVLIARPIFSTIAISETLYSKEADLPDSANHLLQKLKDKYTKDKLLVLFDYPLSRATPKYRKTLIKKLNG
jgi:hypothetical protein